ncbi:Uncharacterised protein [Mycobacteroides abscessus subsp. abscessus]|nr:Uncharacterised protein [Mycobacteroides abscessus subsp. abscessus]
MNTLGDMIFGGRCLSEAAKPTLAGESLGWACRSL